MHSGSMTPLNPMAIAQAVAGATGSSGMSGEWVVVAISNLIVHC